LFDALTKARSQLESARSQTAELGSIVRYLAIGIAAVALIGLLVVGSVRLFQRLSGPARVLLVATSLVGLFLVALASLESLDHQRPQAVALSAKAQRNIAVARPWQAAKGSPQVPGQEPNADVEAEKAERLWGGQGNFKTFGSPSQPFEAPAKTVRKRDDINGDSIQPRGGSNVKQVTNQRFEERLANARGAKDKKAVAEFMFKSGQGRLLKAPQPTVTMRAGQAEPDIRAQDRPALRFGGSFQDGTSKTLPIREFLGGARTQAPPLPVCIVREYAHQHPHGESNVRSDFTETLLWQPALVLHDGHIDIPSFELCDSVTTFKVLVAGHTLDGRLGAATLDIDSRLPLTIEPKLPIEVTASDRLQIPVSIANNSEAHQHVTVHSLGRNVDVTPVGGQASVSLGVDARRRVLYEVHPTITEGLADLRFDATAGAVTDQVARSVRVVPDGFSVLDSKSDLLEGTARHDFVLPDTWLPGTLKYRVAAYPSTLADLQKGLEGLLREPNGCFEQTSSSNYPNVLILDYLKETDQTNLDVARRAQEFLAQGYQKLTSFECTDPGDHHRWGYEWFGGQVAPHEALTAYGLLEFRDMARVYPIDGSMLQRTKEYLLSRRDGKGGFTRNPRSCDHFGRAPDHITNAYIVWSLTESSKDDDVTKELDALVRQARSASDPYFLALVGNSLLNRGRVPEALAILQTIRKAQKADGHIEAAETSITGSGGRDLEIETTSLALLGWLKAQRPDEFTTAIQAAARWIGQQRGGYGGFGSTQSTILALKSLIAFAKLNKRQVEEGDLIISVNGSETARQHFPAAAQEAIVLDLPSAETLLRPGQNSVRIDVTGHNHFPFTSAWSCRTTTPPSAFDCPIAFATRLDRAKAAEGESVELNVSVDNNSDRGQGMTVAIIGLPAGLSLPEDLKQLKDLAHMRNNGTEPGVISAWEIRGRELVLYWRELAPRQHVRLKVDLVCRVPGQSRGPASRAYLYYNADHKRWVEPLKIDIAAKE
jgi:hypothetical protein